MSVMLRISVYDQPGVVDRITGLIRRCGWNISAINAGEVKGAVSDINILLKQKDVEIGMISKQLSSLDCVRDWESCTHETHFIRELLSCTAERSAAAELLAAGAREVDRQGDVLFLEYTAPPEEIDHFVDRFAGEVLGCARTGVLSIARKGAGA